MARRIEPLPAFPKELAYLGWTLIKAQGTSALKAVNSRLHCTSPNFASDGRAWAKKKAERAAAKGALPEPPHVRAEIVECACSMTEIATPLVEALDRAVPHSTDAPRALLFWSVTTTGAGRGRDRGVGGIYALVPPAVWGGLAAVPATAAARASAAVGAGAGDGDRVGPAGRAR